MNVYHIVWVTHNSRVSERMIKYHVKRGEPLFLSQDEEVEITGFIRDIVEENGYILLAYNICEDHVHLVLVCEEDKRDAIVGHLKGKATHLYKKAHGIETTFHLWGQKYKPREICDDEQLHNTIEYIRYNRRKHGLPPNKQLRPIVLQMLKSVKDVEFVFVDD